MNTYVVRGLDEKSRKIKIEIEAVELEEAVLISKKLCATVHSVELLVEDESSKPLSPENVDSDISGSEESNNNANSFNKITHIKFFVHYLLYMLIAFAPIIYAYFSDDGYALTKYNTPYFSIASSVWMIVLFGLFDWKHKSIRPGAFGYFVWGVSAFVLNILSKVLFKDGAILFTLGWLPALFLTYFIGVYVTKFIREESYKGNLIKCQTQHGEFVRSKGCLMIFLVVLIALFILIRFI